MAKMRVPMPRIQPSVRASMAEETTPLAKPVMGTSVPAPACLPSLAYQPSPVQTALTATSPMETHAEAFFCSMPQYSVRIWMPASPMVQISPPIRNARGMFFQDFDRGAV